MDTKSMGFSLLSKSLQRHILEQQGEQVPAELEATPEAQQPEAQPEAQQAADAHAENVRKYGAMDAERMRKYGLSARDL